MGTQDKVQCYNVSLGLKNNLHFSLNILNFKPLEMMQKRFFFSEPCHVRRSTLLEKQPLGPALRRDRVPGRHGYLFPLGLGAQCSTQPGSDLGSFLPHRLPSSSIYISTSERGLPFLKDINAIGKVLIPSPKGIISTTCQGTQVSATGCLNTFQMVIFKMHAKRVVFCFLQ